jgi:endonuclease IV
MGRIIKDKRLSNAAFIMETPKNTDRDDKMNMAIVRKMIKA